METTKVKFTDNGALKEYKEQQQWISSINSLLLAGNINVANDTRLKKNVFIQEKAGQLIEQKLDGVQSEYIVLNHPRYKYP